MDDIIMKIIDIEEKAQEIIKDAREANENLEKNVQAETEKLHQDIERRAQIKGETVRDIEMGDAEERIKKIRRETEKGIADLEARYKEKKPEWVGKIVGNIIG